MAEIKIEKKQPIWPWILLAIGAAVLIYYFFFRDKEAEQEVIQDVEDTTSMIKIPAGNSPAPAQYTEAALLYA